MENIVHFVHNIPEEDLIDIVEVYEDVNSEAIMDNDEDTLLEDRTIIVITTKRFYRLSKSFAKPI